MSSAPIPEGVPPGAPVVPQGPVPAVGVPNSQDYPRLVYTAPRFEVVAIADIIEPSVLEACEALLPTLVPPYVNQAAIDAVNATAVRRAGDTMTGPLNLSPVIPTANAMAASKQYVDTMIATGAVPEVPPVPSGQAWARETGQWVPIAGGGTVTNIATGAGLTGGPITATGTIAMANMNGNTLKGNNTGAVAAPTDLSVGQVMTMLGAAPLASPAFTGSPTLPTGTQAVTQPGGTSDTTVATTAFVASSLAAQLISPAFTGNPTAPTPAPGDNDTSIATTAFVATSFAPLASPVFTGAPSLPTGTVAVTQTAGTANTSVATTAFVGAAFGSYLPLTGGRLSGGLASGPAATAVPGIGALTLNANTVAPPAAGLGGTNQVGLWVAGADGAQTNILMDTFGTGGIPGILHQRAARGTAAARTAIQLNDYIGAWRAQGYNGTAYGAPNAGAILIGAAENWTGSANGTYMQLETTPAGGTSSVNSLTLAGNTATFSGNVGCATFGIPAGTPLGSLLNTPQFQYSGSGLIVESSNNGVETINKIGSPGAAIGFYQAGSNCGSITVTPSTTAYNTSSDARLKDDLKDFDAGPMIDQLSVYDFKWKDYDERGYGVLAQQAITVFPSAITHDEEKDTWAADYSKFVPLLLNEIKALRARVAQLEAVRAV